MKKRVLIIFCAVLIAVLSLGLTACGGSGGGENGQVYIYSLGDYIDPELVDVFEEETGIEVILDTFDTNEEMYPVIAKNTVTYDVICTSDYMVERMMGEGLLQEIDHANLPNLSNMMDEYMEIAADFDPGNKYAVPHTWGTLGIMYNSDNIPEGTLTSWNDLWDEKYSQQIVMPDSMRDNFAIALKALGYSINTTDEKELAEATQLLIDQKDLVYSYVNDSARDLAIGGSADIAVVWSGEVIYSRTDNESLKFVIPEEGSEEFLDMWAIPAAAENKENAEAWINFMLDQETAVTNYEYLTYTIPNTAVYDYIKDIPEDMAVVFPDQSVLTNCEMLHSLGAENDDLYSTYWKQFKAE